MYRRPKFLEELDEIRVEMSREADCDVDVFATMIRTGKKPRRSLRKKSITATVIEKLESGDESRRKKPIEKVTK